MKAQQHYEFPNASPSTWTFLQIPKVAAFLLSTRCCVITDLHDVSFIRFVLNCKNVMLLFFGHGRAALLLVWNRCWILSSQMTTKRVQKVPAPANILFIVADPDG